MNAAKAPASIIILIIGSSLVNSSSIIIPSSSDRYTFSSKSLTTRISDTSWPGGNPTLFLPVRTPKYLSPVFASSMYSKSSKSAKPEVKPLVHSTGYMSFTTGEANFKTEAQALVDDATDLLSN